jgi:deoxyribonuclease-4
MPLIGSHATVTGGLATGGLRYAAEVGAEVIQVFVSSPRGWAAAQIGTGPFRDLLAARPDVPFVVETPGGKAGHARDIATLKGLR